MNDRLPGIRFEDLPEVLGERLPRMDIAAFAGFARRGPLDLPVAVEDVAQFENLFGGDHLLFTDAADGSPVHAQLAPAVRAFFRNGGRRCWVTRLAYRPFTARLPLPGLWRQGPTGFQPAQARACAPGRWGYALLTAARLQSAPLQLLGDAHRFDGGTPTRLALDPASPGRPEPGDLLRLSGPTVGDGERDLVVLLVEAGALSRRARGRHGERLDTRVRRHWWFARPAAWPASFELLLSLPRARQVSGQLDGSLAQEGVEAIIAFAFGLPETLQPAEWPRPDDPVRLRAGTRFCCGRLLSLQLRGRSGGQLRFAARAQVLEALPGPVDVDGMPAGERLRLELTLTDAAAGTRRLSDLGFFAPHPRAWRALPDDAALHAGVIPAAQAALWREATTPRFPLAGLAAADALPIGLPWAEPAQLAARQDQRNGMARDGLKRLSASLFLDPQLAETPAERLMDTAEALRQPIDPIRHRGRRLSGIHAFMPLEEVTLVAAPDAGLCYWLPATAAVAARAENSPPLPDPLCNCGGGADVFRPASPRREAAPTLALQDIPGGRRAQWTPAGLDSAAHWTLQGSTHPDWSDAHELQHGPGTVHDFDPQRQPWRFLRVRRDDAIGFSDWSGAVTVLPPESGGWVRAAADAEARRIPLRVQRAMLRLAAARADVVAVLGTPAWMDAGETLRHVAALSRIALPGEDEAIAAGVFDGSEQRLPSYGAFYHPWLRLAPEQAGGAEWIAPEGPACGLIARRALARGAWIAPANEVVQDALALRELPVAAAQPLFDLGVNLWRSDGLRIRALGARTLSSDPQWTPLNVRRLLQLLRRLLLREGVEWVFEPNGGALHRAIERGLSAWLAFMHARGAFAGRRPQDAWQLSVDGSGADVGRLVVELRVAPSRPLEFISVRLVRQGDRLSALEL